MKNLELFKIKINGPMDSTSDLYVRVEEGSFDSNTGVFDAGTVISLDTYFNTFSCSKYKKWTTITRASAELDVDGRIKIELFRRQKGEDDKLICSQEGNGSISIPFDFSYEQSHCYYFLRLTALGEKCTFLGGAWCADTAPAPVKVAVIICTYRREDYILKNIAALRDELLDAPSSPVRDDLELFVVDNGQSLEGRFPEHPRVRLFYNKNCGGSGGFTRGLIEALKRKDELTHVLLMDDDVVIDTNAIEKTIQFLKVLRPEYTDLHIAGGMLYMDRPTIQHEATARWDGNIHPNNAGLDFTDPQTLLENEIEKDADYAAWWYLCFSLNHVNPNNLPMPFFIKGDDVEYGMRNMRRVLVMNGIGVWHEGFIGKERPYLDYYIIRNYLVISAVHNIKTKTSVILLVLFKRMMRSVIFDVPEVADIIAKAVRDYLAGPEFFVHTDSEAVNSEIRLVMNKVLKEAYRRKLWKIASLLIKIPTRDFWIVITKYANCVSSYLREYKKTNKMYHEKWIQLVSLEHWEKMFT